MSAAPELRPGWVRVRFGDIVSNVRQTTQDPVTDGLERVVGLDHLDSESLPLRRWDELADLPDGTSFTLTFRVGQVLFGKRRAYQRKVAVPDFDGICSGDILVFEPSAPSLLREFLPYVVQSDGFFDHALGTSAGSLSPRTRWQELAKYEFALPPLDEQRQIAGIMRALDAVVETGVTAAQCAQRLCSAVVEEKVAADTVELAAFAAADRPIAYGVLKPDLGGPTGVPMVRVQNINGPLVELTDDTNRISSELSTEFARTELRAGDIVVSVVGTVGRVAEVGKSLEGANVSRAIAVLRPKEGVDRRLLVSLLNGPSSQRWITANCSGGVQKVLNLSKLRRLPVAWPAASKRSAVLEALSAAQAVADAAHACVRDARRVRPSLMAALQEAHEL